MPRPTVIIDRTELETLINDLEGKQVFPNLSALCKSVCESDWAKALKNSVGKEVELKPQVVYNRIHELNIPIKTQAGKKGRVAGSKIDTVRTPRAEKFAKNPLVQKSLVDMRKTMPKSEEGLIKRIEGGSLKAMIKAMCRNCVNYEASLIGDASCSGCPLSIIVFSGLKKYKTPKLTLLDSESETGDNE